MTIPQGSDHTIELRVKSISGNPIDLTDCTAILVRFYTEKKEVVTECSIVAGTVEITNATSGLVNIYLSRLVLQNFTGKLYAQIDIDITNVHFESGVKRTRIIGSIIGDVVESV